MVVIKEKKLLTILAIEAAACVLFCILRYSVSGMFSSLIAFPSLAVSFRCYGKWDRSSSLYSALSYSHRDLALLKKKAKGTEN